MSLNVKFFLVMSGLLACLVGIQWWMLHAFSKDLNQGVDELAITVGRDLIDEVTTVITKKKTHDTAAEDQIMKSRLEVTAETSSENPDERCVKILRKTETETSVEDITHDASDLMELQQAESTFAASVDIMAFNVDEETLFLSLDDETQTRFLVLKSPDVHRRIKIPREQISTPLAKLSTRLSVGTAITFGLGILLAAWVSHRITRPLRRLADAAQRIGAGERGVALDTPIPRDEVGTSMLAFNHMSQSLQQHEKEALKFKDREQLSELGEIARGLAHTIRNPLNALGLSIDQLSTEDIQSQQKRDLAITARQQIRRIDQWVRSFLALASMGAGIRSPLDLMALVQDVVLEILQDPSPKPSLRVQGESAWIQGVAGEIRAVIQALVVNAVEATPEHGEILVRVSQDDQQARVEVLDEGPGLADSVRARLFTPHTSTKPHGSGMGLFLAHRILTSRYHGTITLNDRHPTGTVAHVTIPIEAIEERSDERP